MEDEKKDVDNTSDNDNKDTNNPAEIIATLQQSLNNVVEELKEVRKEKKIIEDIIAQSKENKNPSDANQDNEVEKLKSVVEQVLSEKEQSRAKANKQAALEAFIAQNSQYSKDNDITGIKRAALERKIAMFNTSGLVEVSDFIEVIRDAHNLLSKNDTNSEKPKEKINLYSSTTETKQQPATVVNTGLSEKEQKLVNMGYSVEKIKALKAKNPDFLDSLLDYVK